jgi:hypothetical protein
MDKLEELIDFLIRCTNLQSINWTKIDADSETEVFILYDTDKKEKVKLVYKPNNDAIDFILNGEKYIFEITLDSLKDRIQKLYDTIVFNYYFKKNIDKKQDLENTINLLILSLE